MDTEAPRSESSDGGGGGGGSNKRRRIAPADASASTRDLTDDNWAAVAKFLPKTSRALLAVALTAPPSSWRKRGWKGEPSGTSRAVVSSAKLSPLFSSEDSCSSMVAALCKESIAGGIGPRLRMGIRSQTHAQKFRAGIRDQINEYYEERGWKIIDFVDVEKSLASKLTDDDIGAILVCIDAKNILERLNLTHCFNVIGHGLEPLRNSTTLTKIDMGLSRWCESPELFEEALISEDAVFPILHDILSGEGNSFRRLQVPLKWCNNSTPSGGLKRFLEKYKHMLNARSICCYFGRAGNRKGFLRQVNRPELMEACNDCSGREFKVCEDCDKILCVSCGEAITCWRCQDGARCYECNETSESHRVRSCGAPFCEERSCDDCRVAQCREGHDCDGCRSLAFDRLAEEVDTKRAKIVEQRGEILRLRRKMDELRREVDELREGKVGK